jgi:hypothetical protein
MTYHEYKKMIKIISSLLQSVMKIELCDLFTQFGKFLNIGDDSFLILQIWYSLYNLLS